MGRIWITSEGTLHIDRKWSLQPLSAVLDSLPWPHNLMANPAPTGPWTPARTTSSSAAAMGSCAAKARETDNKSDCADGLICLADSCKKYGKGSWNRDDYDCCVSESVYDGSQGGRKIACIGDDGCCSPSNK